MHKDITISLSQDVYEGLYKRLDASDISQFIEDIVRPYVVTDALEAGYRMMAADSAQEAEALEWAEALIGDVVDEAW